jgi:hypothetical protein
VGTEGHTSHTAFTIVFPERARVIKTGHFNGFDRAVIGTDATSITVIVCKKKFCQKKTAY